MNQSKLKDWIAMGTNIAVVAGIIFLAVELRQNNAWCCLAIHISRKPRRFY